MIKERIYNAQYDSLKAVNKELINLYWDIGKLIVAKQDKIGWGKGVVETLAKEEDCFGGDCFEGALAMTALERARNEG